LVAAFESFGGDLRHVFHWTIQHAHEQAKRDAGLEPFE
jgi:hypothetical protein